VNTDDEVQAGQDGRKAHNERAGDCENDVRVRVGRTKRGIESPSGVDTAVDCSDQREDPADHVDIPTEQIQAGEGQIFGTKHQRQQEIAEHRRNRRDQEEEDHNDPVQREHAIIHVRRHQITLRRHQFESHEGSCSPAEQEEEVDRQQVEDGDTFVIDRQEPRLHPVDDAPVVSVYVAARYRNTAHRLCSFRKGMYVC
jgi:hypothetical protein